MELKAHGWKRYRGVLIVALLISAAILLGYVAAMDMLYGLPLVLVGLGCIALVYIIFRTGRLLLASIIVPLLAAAVLLPSIQLPGMLPSVRLELVIIIIAWAFFILGQFAVGKPVKLRWNPINKWFFLFCACILASIAYAAFFMGYYPIARDFWEFGKLIEYFLIFALVASLKIPPEHMRKYYIISLISFLCSAVFGLAQYFNLFDMNSWLIPYYAPTQVGGLINGSRIVGSTGNPNDFGALMVLAASLSITGALWLTGHRIKLFCWVALGVFSLTISFTQSRSALICLLAVVIFILFIQYFLHFGVKRAARIYLLAVPLLFILALLLLQFAPSLFFMRMNDAMDLSTSQGWLARLADWNHQLIIFKQSPIFGWGPGKDTMGTNVDNEWVLLLRRYGALGVMVFILWFAGVYRTLSRIRRETRDNYTETFCVSLQATLIAYAIYMIPSAVYHNLQLMPILLIFLALAFTQRRYSQAVQLK